MSTFTNKIAATFVLALTLSSAAFAQRTSVAHKVAEQRIKSVVAIANTEPGKLDVWGAGTIVDSRGYVLTCNHVIDEMKQISVGFTDGQYLPATVVFADKNADVALLRVNGKRTFPEVQMAPADLELGEPLIIIGSPKGLTFTVSAGIVSRIADYTFGTNVFKNAIQTDGSINPGNSGGPVFNGDGELVGMAFLKLMGTDGLAWANNGDQVELTLARGASAEKVAGVEHGLSLEERKVEGGKGLARRGVFVKTASSESHGAFKAGDRIVRVRAHDVVYAINNRFEFERALYDTDPQEVVTVVVLREGHPVVVPLTLSGEGVDRDGR